MRLMIDLETWALGPDAEIIAGALVVFDDQIRVRQALTLYPQPHRLRDPKTEDWWDQRKETLNKIQNLKIKASLKSFLLLIKSTIQVYQITEVWAKSPSFDLAILAHAYQEEGIEKPWTYKQENDVRTIENILKKKSSLTYINTPHDPLADAEAQALNVIRVMDGG